MSSKNRSRYNFDATKKQAARASSGGAVPYLNTPQGAALFQLKEGQILIDILPYEVTSKTNPLAEKGTVFYARQFFVHNQIGANNERFVCPLGTFKRPCPICEYRMKLKKKGYDDLDEEIKALSQKERIVVNLIDLKHPDKGVQILETSLFNFGRILKEVNNGDEDENLEQFWSPDEGGRTLKIQVVDESIGTGTFAKIDSVHFKPRRKPYDDDILEQTHDLDKMLVETSYDDLKKALLGGGDDDDADDDDADEEDDAPPRKKKPAADDEDDDEDDDEEVEVKPGKRKSGRDVEERIEDPEDDEEEDEDEDDEPPKKKKSAPSDEEEDWDDLPKKKSKASAEDEDDEDEEKPAKKKSKSDDDEGWDDFAPKKKSKAAPVDDDEDEEDEDEDDDEPPKKKSKRVVDEDDDDEEEEKPRVKTRTEILEEDEDEDEEEEAPKKKKRH